MKEEKLSNPCDKCSRNFKTLSGLKRHKTCSHRWDIPAPPPPPPKRIVLSAPPALLETLTLLGGQNMDVGDVFWQSRKFVIKKITKTAGSIEVEVQAEVTKRIWSSQPPHFT